MPQEKLNLGPIQAMTAGVAYALPAVSCILYTDATTPTLTQSTTAAFTASTTVTLTAGQSPVLAGGFIRVSTTGINVIVKRV